MYRILLHFEQRYASCFKTHPLRLVWNLVRLPGALTAIQPNTFGKNWNAIDDPGLIVQHQLLSLATDQSPPRRQATVAATRELMVLE